jgi:hypothetical protein
MGYQPAKSPKGTNREYKKPFREKCKEKKQSHRQMGKTIVEEKHTTTEREITELTLKRLHTLGIQKFGSFPFSIHFDRWLSNVEAVLGEFEAHPTIGVDDEFVKECSDTLSAIKNQLDDRRRKEASVDTEVKNLSDSRNRLQRINTEYSTVAGTAKSRKNGEIKQLYNAIDHLKNEQDKIIKTKTGLFRGISKKEREQKEITIAQELMNKQTELEIAILDLRAAQKKIREDYDKKKEPLQEKIKVLQKRIEYLEMDGSLEERWFACDALIDALNMFLQRKATQPH